MRRATFIAQVGKVIEFNTSCAPPFVQQAGIVAVRDGEPLVAETVARLRASRDLLVRELAAIPGVEVAPPPGAMYLFFKVAGFSGDSLAFAKRLVAEAGLGIAPGAAFGPEGEGYLRWCFAASDALLLQGADAPAHVPEERARCLGRRAVATSPRFASIGSTAASRPRNAR